MKHKAQEQLTTEDEVEVGDFISLSVDGPVPVDGFYGHAAAQVLTCLVRQLSQEGVQEHETDGQLVDDGQLIHGRQHTADVICWSVPRAV